VGGAEIEWHVEHLPTFRSVDIQVIATVTAGARPAPPLLPMAGLMSDRGWAAFGAGFLPLLIVTTNRVAAEVYQRVLGWPAVVADVTRERLPGMTRYVGTTGSGGVLVDVMARRCASSRPFREAQPLYCVRDGAVFRATIAGRGAGGGVTGRGVALQSLADHPAVGGLRGIGLRERGFSRNDCEEFDQRVTGPVTIVGRARAGLAPPATDTPAAEAVLVASPTVRVPVDQGLDGLPFDPAGEFGTDERTG
jgi:hypothetical protein